MLKLLRYLSSRYLLPNLNVLDLVKMSISVVVAFFFKFYFSILVIKSSFLFENNTLFNGMRRMAISSKLCMCFSG